MQAKELLATGQIQAALSELEADIRKKPGDAGNRAFLFQLAAVMGAWERALTQLEVAGQLDAGALPMVQTYRTALECEAFRADVFAGRKSPLIFGDPQEWIVLLLEALKLDAAGNTAQAQATRALAFDGAPVTSGTIGDKKFEWIADADGRLGPVCEAILNGKYYWIPFCRLARIEMEAPVDLRDFVWAPATLTFVNGGQSVALIPTRYPGTEKSGDDLARLARKTEWIEAGEGVYRGLGQRMWATSEEEYPLLDIRTVELVDAAAA